MTCQRCGNDTVYTLTAKSNDRNFVWDEKGQSALSNDYLDGRITKNIGDNDTIRMEWCRYCGQIQGLFDKEAYDAGSKS